VIGIICGSGLSNLSSSFENCQVIPYSSIPGFPSVTISGHVGELVFGTLNGIECVCLRGRFHYYEGNSMEQVVLPVRVMRLMGVKMLIVTNAAGGLNPDYNVGDIMVIQDHFGTPCIAGNHPLRGPNDDALGPRFIAMSDCYDAELQSMLLDGAQKLGLSKKVRANGTYCFVSGPCYETKVESRFLRSIGGDSVGMSTVPEVIAAKHCGMKILGLSLVTNKVVLVDSKDAVHATHAEVLAAANEAGEHVENLVKYVISKKVIGAFLKSLPDFHYQRKPIANSCDSKAACCPAAKSCDAKGACCPTVSACLAGDCSPCCKVVTVLGVAAVLAGLFMVSRCKRT